MLREPFPNNHWCPTAGITLESVPEWFAAGADLIGLGGPVTKGGVTKVSENVMAFRNAINQASKVIYQHEVSQ
jgi:2-dehydro-3-deoxyphosphogluconate aldolase/(4S)-4-hydroxy-2-oxoglutarate aldolase